MPPTRQPKNRAVTGPMVAVAPPSGSSSDPQQLTKPTKKHRAKRVAGVEQPLANPAVGEGKAKAKAKAKPIDEYDWHPTVDYTSLVDQERQSRTILDLYTIFSMGGRNGLTVHNVRQMAKELDMRELADSSPTTIRNAIERWSSLLQSLSNNGRRCDHIGCKKPAAWGHWNEDPLACERHKEDGMILLVPGRVVKMDDTPDGKYLMTDPLFSHIFPPDAAEGTMCDTSSWWPELFDIASTTELDELLQSMTPEIPEEETRLAQEINNFLSEAV